MENVQLIGSLSVEKRVSKSGNSYVALILDLGYTKKVLSVNAGEIAEYLGKSVVELYQIAEKGGK